MFRRSKHPRSHDSLMCEPEKMVSKQPKHMLLPHAACEMEQQGWSVKQSLQNSVVRWRQVMS